MNAPFTPEKMTEAERMQEIGQLLATAMERMHRASPKNPGTMPDNSLDSADEESVYA
jgi:hypothetical protein